MATQTLQPDITRQASAYAGALPVSGQIKNNLRSLARSKLLWGLLLLAAALGYGYAMAVPAVDMDDLAIATYQQGGEFLRQGRITVWLLQALTGIMTYQRFWPELFFAASLLLAGMVLAAVLYVAARRQPGVPGVFLLAAGLLLWPYHGEILMYSNQCGVGLGYLLCALALALVLPHLLDGWHTGWRSACGAAVCLCFALGLYESFAPVWLTLVFTALLLDAGAAEPHSRKAAGICGSVLRGIWPLAAALVLRKALAAVLCAANGVSGQDGTASKTIFWFRRASLKDAVVIPVREWLTNYVARAFGVPALALLALACWAVVLWCALHRRGNGQTLFAAGLVISQFSLGLLQGTGAQMARAVQCFAVFVPFALWLWLAPELDGHPEKKWKTAVCAALTVVFLAVEWTSLTGTIQYNRDRWQYEEQLLEKTAAQLDELDPTGTLPVAFVGEAELPEELQQRLVIPQTNPAYKAAYLIYAVLGGPLGDLERYENPQTLVINWAQDAFGGKQQMLLLMQQAGRPCTLAEPEQQDEANVLAAAGEAPAGVSQQDGYLLVNFTGWN